MKKILGAALLAFAALLAMSRGTPSSAAPEIEGLGPQLVAQINTYRQSQGLRPLVWDSRLYNAAHAHNDLMGAQNQMAHQLPGEPDFGRRVQNSGFDPMYAAGETLAAGAYDPVKVKDLWRGSRGHDEIMRGDFTSVGCDLKLYPGTTYGSYATCDFGKTDLSTAPTAPARPSLVSGRIYRFQFYLPASHDNILAELREMCGSQNLGGGRYQGQVGAGCYFYGTTADNSPPTSKVGWAYVEFRDFTPYYRWKKDVFLQMMPGDTNLWQFIETPIP